jgi:UDP-N-acetylmuramoylalanine--D-glutamate ligase
LAAIDWSGRAVTVMGLGTHGGGVAATRYLAQRGARVTVSDSADRATLVDSIAELCDLPLVAIHTGGHVALDFQTEFVVVNPAVRPDHACLRIARRCGARLISETELFLADCPGQVIGVTGSNGKSTTCTMLHAILSVDGRRTWLGGNIGRSLLGDLERMTPADWVVIELSSFQLAHLSPDARMPRRAVVTSCSPNHLDWHESVANYVAAKQRILGGAQGDSQVVLGALGAATACWAESAGSRAVAPWPLEKVPLLSVPGMHNRRNAACAAATAALAGVDEATIAGALAGFRGLPHRIELVAEIAGRRFFNDSKSTSPEAAMAALSAVDGDIWLVAGGHSKGAHFGELAGAIFALSRGAALFGEARAHLRAEIVRKSPTFALSSVACLEDAVGWCWRQSRPGDTILLSPACASHDQFRDYRERGETFRAVVGQIDRRGAACVAR